VTRCTDCGSWGHRGKSPRCPYRETLKRQDPFGLNPPRPLNVDSRVLDPAIRAATATTVFLPGVR
jgi:hypothetical protein